MMKDDSGRIYFVQENLRPMSKRCHTSLHPGYGCASSTANHHVEQLRVRCFDRKCEHCGAWTSDTDKPSLCCRRGKVDLSTQFASYEDRPTLIRDLCEVNRATLATSRRYRKDSLAMNKELALGSITVGSERPRPGGYQSCRVNALAGG